MEQQPKRVIGIDLAKRSYMAKLIDMESGKEKVWEGKTDGRGIDSLIRKFQEGDRIGIECCGQAMKLIRIITARVAVEALLLNPGQLQIIYKSTKKTDLEDAAKIAMLLQRFPAGELPVVQMPSPEEEHQRALVSESRSKSKLRNMLVNRLHSLFVREAITTMKRGDLKDHDRREESLKVLQGYTLKEARRICRELAVVEEDLAEINGEIKGKLVVSNQASKLMSIPGVGPVAAMTFMAYVGDGSRFTTGRQVGNYAGMTPRVDSSGETT